MSADIEGSTVLNGAREAGWVFTHGLLAQFETDYLLYLGLEFGVRI
jgi:hypothetical protein